MYVYSKYLFDMEPLETNTICKRYELQDWVNSGVEGKITF